jgi:hypothetical protein
MPSHSSDISTFVDTFFSPEKVDTTKLKEDIASQLPQDAILFWRLVPLQPTTENDGKLPVDVLRYAFWDLTCHGYNGVKGVILPRLYSLKGETGNFEEDDKFSTALYKLLYLFASDISPPVY